MTPHITVQGKRYELVRVQRGGSSFVYHDNGTYLRIGEPRIIKKHLDAHTLMEAAGFPVPRILMTGEHDGKSFFLETSMGDLRLGDAFANDYVRDGVISDQHFQEFLAIARDLAEAQLKAPKPPGSLRGFKPAIHVRTLCRELPGYAEKIEARFAEITKRLSVFPTVLSHGDFNAQNLFKNGIIDLEHAFQGPWGYDLVTALVHINQFPDSNEYEYFARYRFSEKQEEVYRALLDEISTKNGLPRLTEYLHDFEFCRAVWSSVRMAEHPKLQKWRYDLFLSNFLQ